MEEMSRVRKLIYCGHMAANSRGDFTIGGDAPWPMVKRYHERLPWHREIEFFLASLIRTSSPSLESTPHVVDPSKNTTRIVPAGVSAGYLKQVFDQTLSATSSYYNSEVVLIVTFRETPTNFLEDQSCRK